MEERLSSRRTNDPTRKCDIIMNSSVIIIVEKKKDERKMKKRISLCEQLRDLK